MERVTQKNVRWDVSVRDNDRILSKECLELLKRGIGLKKEGNVEGALESYSTVIERIRQLESPSDGVRKILANAHVLRGNAHQLNKNFSKACSDYDKGKEIDPRSIRYVRQEKRWDV